MMQQNNSKSMNKMVSNEFMEEVLVCEGAARNKNLCVGVKNFQRVHIYQTFTPLMHITRRGITISYMPITSTLKSLILLEMVGNHNNILNNRASISQRYN